MNPTRTTTTALIALLASTLHAHAGVVDCQPTPSSEWTQTIRNVCYDPQFGPTTTVEGGFPSFVDLQADVYHCLTYFNTIYTYGVFEGSQFEGTPTEWVGHGILVRLVHAYNLDHGTQKRIAVGVGPADPWSKWTSTTTPSQSLISMGFWLIFPQTRSPASQRSCAVMNGAQTSWITGRIRTTASNP